MDDELVAAESRVTCQLAVHADRAVRANQARLPATSGRPAPLLLASCEASFGQISEMDSKNFDNTNFETLQTIIDSELAFGLAAFCLSFKLWRSRDKFMLNCTIERRTPYWLTASTVYMSFFKTG